MDQDLETLNAGSHYKFSATRPEKLGASEYTLVTVVCDTSGSVQPFAAQLELMLKTVFKACNKADNARRENILFRLTQFNDGLTELHGFKELGKINEDDYTNILQLGGMTALFDAADEALKVSEAYAEHMVQMSFDVNAIVFIITDGQNNIGRIRDASAIRHTVETVIRSEKLMSVVTVLVGVTNDDTNLDAYLSTFKNDANLSQYVSIGKATPGKLAKLAQFVSQSISSTSQALAGKTVSQPIAPPTF